MLSAENTSILLGHHSSRVNLKPRVHPGIQEILPPAISMALSSPSFLRTLDKAGAHSLTSLPLAEPNAIAMQMDHLVTGLSRFPRELFHQHLGCLFSHSPPSSFQQSSLREMHSNTEQIASQTQPPVHHVLEAPRVKLKDMARNERRDIITPGSVSPSVIPSTETSF